MWSKEVEIKAKSLMMGSEKLLGGKKFIIKCDGKRKKDEDLSSVKNIKDVSVEKK